MISPVSKGQKFKITAEAFNAMAAAANAHGHGSAGPGARATAIAAQTGVIVVRNDSGADCERFDILGIDCPLILPTDDEDRFTEQVALSGVLPVEADHGGRVIILQEPIAAGECGKGMILGTTPVTLTVTSESDMTAGIIDNDVTMLRSGGPLRILWKEEGTGEKWAIVQFSSGQAANQIATGIILGAYQLRGIAYGLGYSPDIIEAASAAWDPDGDIVAQAFEPGLGVAQLGEVDSLGAEIYVLVINDAARALAPQEIPAYQAVVIEMSRPVVLPVTGSDPAATVTCYPVRLL